MSAPPSLRLSGDLVLEGRVLCRDLELECPAGVWTVLLGPSGVGKSTLARLLAELPSPAHLRGGIMASDGAPLAGRVTLMAQTDQLLPWADVLANVTLGARLRGTRPDRARAMALLREVGLEGAERQRPGTLSGGQRQRVALARTLMEDHRIVVMDEPFSALDAATRAAMQDLAARMLTGRTVVLITHDPLEAARLATRGYLMSTAGAVALALPAEPAPRALSSPATLSAQAALYRHLLALPGAA
ncbi:MAG: ABC transporter ATP-binding protein [Rhodobacterales bacterium]